MCQKLRVKASWSLVAMILAIHRGLDISLVITIGIDHVINFTIQL